MIPIELQGKNQLGNQAKVAVHTHEGDTGLIVYPEPRHIWRPTFAPALNDTYGLEMAQDFSFGGTPVLVHDGIDSVLWTGSNITGNKVTFNHADRANSGSTSVRVSNASVNHVWQFDKGSDIDLSNSIAITMFINVDKNWSAGDSIAIYGWDTGAGTIVGNQVSIEDYFNAVEFDTWHKLSIPYEDLGLSSATIDAIRFEVNSKQGTGPQFFIDDMQLEETGNTQTFSVKPREGQIMELLQISFSIVDQLDTTLLNNSMPNLSYDKFLGEPALENGLLFQSVVNNQVLIGLASKTIGSLIKSGATLKNLICDGTNTCITLETDFLSPVLLDSRTNDSFNYILSDDLTGLISLSIILKGRQRDF